MSPTKFRKRFQKLVQYSPERPRVRDGYSAYVVVVFAVVSVRHKLVTRTIIIAVRSDLSIGPLRVNTITLTGLIIYLQRVINIFSP
jgi:hypothetical protein